MQKKSIIIPIVGFIGVGLLFASSGLFPDTASLPRFPTQPGTIGGVLTAFFNSDGTAKNTESLSGTTASGYLQNQNCTDPLNPVWTGIDPSGKAICGTTGPLLALARFSEITPGVEVQKNGMGPWIPLTTSDDLHAGDIIRTGNSGTGTIRFNQDESLLRLATDTTLELRVGDLDGNSVAEAILSDGRLWGRILSNTGINLGGGGIVTGVRGTSVDIIKSSTGLYTVTITDSVNTNSKLSSNSTLDFKDAMTLSSVSNSTFGGGVQFSYMSGDTNITKLTQDKNLFYSDSWVKSNTLLDVDYMSTELEKTYLSFDAKTRLNNELNATIELSNTGTLYALLAGVPFSSNLDRLKAADLLNDENTLDGFENQETINKNKDNRLKCKMELKTFFPGIGDCRGSWDTLAITDFNLSKDIYGKKNAHGIISQGGSNNIDTGNLYLKYDISNINSLLGKTMVVKYSGITQASKMFMFLGTAYWIKRDNMNASWQISSGLMTGGWVIDTSIANQISITFPPSFAMTVTHFIYGNNSNFNLANAHLGLIIDSIEIK